MKHVLDTWSLTDRTSAAATPQGGLRSSSLPRLPTLRRIREDRRAQPLHLGAKLSGNALRLFQKVGFAEFTGPFTQIYRVHVMDAPRYGARERDGLAREQPRRITRGERRWRCHSFLPDPIPEEDVEQPSRIGAVGPHVPVHTRYPVV